MQARRKLTLDRKGTKQFLDCYVERLVCVRHRYDEKQRKRVTTVEIMVEESGWTPLAASVAEPVIVGLGVGLNQMAIQRIVKQADGKWDR